DEAIAALSAGRALGPLSASLQLKLFHKARSRYLRQEVGSTGATVLYLSPGLRWTPWPRTSAYGYVQLPLYRYVNETQLGPRRGLLVGISQAF
ncbi:MAG TPA: hypothetical protein VF310_06425, partial [Vicinamibacteria bacterium]